MAPVAGAGSGAGTATSLYTEIVAGTGGLFITVALIAILFYFELFDVSEYQNDTLRALPLSGIVALVATFVSIVVFEVVFAL